MNFTDIELFLCIVDNNSITRAAQLKNLAQSTASYRVKLLEDELGIQLFYRNRGNRLLDLTYQGELFVPLAKK